MSLWFSFALQTYALRVIPCARWVARSCDIPHSLKLEEHNVAARRTIASTPRLDPDCGFRQVWDLIQVVLLLYMAVALPVRVGFSLPDPAILSFNFWFGVMVDLYFAVDIYLSFVTCFYDEDGALVTEARILFAAYFQGWFFLDMVSVLPVGYIGYMLPDAPRSSQNTIGSNTTDTGQSEYPMDLQVIKLMKLLRLIKLLRLARLKRLVKKYQYRFYELARKLQAFKLLIIIVGVAHWLACVWFFVGTLDSNGWIVRWVAQRDEYTGVTGEPLTPEDAPLGDLYLLTYNAAINTLISGSVPSDVDTATRAELFFSLFAIVEPTPI